MKTDDKPKTDDAPLSIREFAQAIEDAPKLAEAPFALTPPKTRVRRAKQTDLFAE